MKLVIITIAVLLSFLWVSAAAPVEKSGSDSAQESQGIDTLGDGGDDLETANALVFRPLFIYRRRQANKYRNVNRRSGNRRNWNRWNGNRRCPYYY